MTQIQQESVRIARLLEMQKEIKSIQRDTGLGDKDLKSILLRWKSGYEPVDTLDKMIWIRFERFRKVPDDPE